MHASPPQRELASLALFAEKLADRARLETLPRFRAGGAADSKSDTHFDPVTDADRAAETAMRQEILEAFPDHGVIGEEFDARAARSAWSWTLDPIDGTRSFVAGSPLWTTLIAVSCNEAPLIGVIDCPATNERWVGTPEGAVFRDANGTHPARVRSCPRLAEAVISTTDPVGLFDGAEAGAFELVRRAARLSRYSMDAYAYGLVAIGAIDLVIESGLQPYDVRALAPVIEGAGGALTDWRGQREAVWNGGQVIASGDCGARDEALVALRRSAR